MYNLASYTDDLQIAIAATIFSSVHSCTLPLRGLSMMSELQTSAPVPPEEALASLPGKNKSVIYALCWDHLGTTLSWTQQAQEAFQIGTRLYQQLWNGMKSKSYLFPHQTLPKKLTALIEQQGRKGSVKFICAGAFGHTKLLPLWVLPYWAAVSEAIKIRAQWKKATNWMDDIRSKLFFFLVCWMIFGDFWRVFEIFWDFLGFF